MRSCDRAAIEEIVYPLTENVEYEPLRGSEVSPDTIRLLAYYASLAAGDNTVGHRIAERYLSQLKIKEEY